MEINDCLKQLLYQHDCVIVPGFGGFIGSVKNFEFEPETGFLGPVRKSVAFNQNLVTNDGLLTGYVAAAGNLTNTEAQAEVNTFVSGIRKLLDAGQTANLKDIGSLTLNEDKKIIFIPDTEANYSTETYGLPAIRLVKKGTKAPGAEQNTYRNTVKPRARKARPAMRALRRTFSTFIMILVLLAFVIVQDTIFHANFEKGSLNPFDSFSKSDSKAPVPAPATDSLVSIIEDANTGDTLPPAEYSQPEPAYTEQPAETTTQNPPITTAEPQVSLKKQTHAQPHVDTYSSSSKSTDSIFYIIAGAFSNETNAQKFSDELNEKGFVSQIIKDATTSLIKVTYNTYPTRQSAEAELPVIRDGEHNPRAWVMAVKK